MPSRYAPNRRYFVSYLSILPQSRPIGQWPQSPMPLELACVNRVYGYTTLLSLPQHIRPSSGVQSQLSTVAQPFGQRALLPQPAYASSASGFPFPLEARLKTVCCFL